MTILNIPDTKNQAQTLESLIEALDERGCLVFQVLLGQQAMALLSKDHVQKVTKGLKQ